MSPFDRALSLPMAVISTFCQMQLRGLVITEMIIRCQTMETLLTWHSEGNSSSVTPAADAYDQLLMVTSSSQPQKKQSATTRVASPLQDQLRGTRCRHHSVMTNCLSLHFTVYSRLNFKAEHMTLL